MADRISTLVMFGATGDLARRMLLPSLYGLDSDGLLPQAKEVETRTASVGSGRGLEGVADLGAERLAHEGAGGIRVGHPALVVEAQDRVALAERDPLRLLTRREPADADSVTVVPRSSRARDLHPRVELRLD